MSQKISSASSPQPPSSARAARPRSPSEAPDDANHPAPPLRDQASTANALTRLPDVLLAYLCPFLAARDLYRLAATCSALGRSCFPSSARFSWRAELMKGPEADEQELQRCCMALGRLVGRCAGRLKEVRIGDPRLVGPFFKALQSVNRGVGLRLVTSLHIRVGRMLVEPGLETPRRVQVAAEGGMQAVGEVLGSGQLPMLQKLELEADKDVDIYVRSALALASLWAALAAGACPKLERIEIHDFPPTVVAELAAALQSRPEGCARIQTLWLEFSDNRPPCDGLKEACEALAGCLAPCSLEWLRSRGPSCPVQWFNAVVSRVASCEWPVLHTLALSGYGSTSVRECDALLHALARGVCPSLTKLSLSAFMCSDAGWHAVGEAMTGPESACLRRLHAISLCDVFQSPGQMEIFMRGVGEGHGCPELESLDIACYGHRFGMGGNGAFDFPSLADALQPPVGLPRLKALSLRVTCRVRLGRVLEALEQRPHALGALEELHLFVPGISVDDLGSSSLARAMAHQGPLSRLKNLSLGFYKDEGGGGAALVQQLMEAVEAGSDLQQLESLKYECAQSAEALMNRLLRALASKAVCPRLRSFSPTATSTMPRDAVVGGLDMGSLGIVLTGGATCSATLRRLNISFCALGEAELTMLEACLRHPRVVQLVSLELRVSGESSLPALLQMLSALGGRAGNRLRHFVIQLQDLTESQAQKVVQRLVDVIDAGGLPELITSISGYTVSRVVWGGRQIGESELSQAVKSSAGRAWLASW